MSQVFHFISCTCSIPGFAEYSSAGRSLVAFGDQKGNVVIGFRLQKRFPLSASLVCGASSSSSRRNSEYSKPSRGYSRNKQWQNEDRESADDSADEADLLMSKSGPLFSFSGAAKSQASSDSLSKEKEIVELFRKVQAKLREKAAASKDEKGEAARSKDEAKDKTVESLLKLLRKHSTEEGNGNDAPTVKVESKKVFVEEGSSGAPIARPASVFRRKSPIPQAKVDVGGGDRALKAEFEEEVETHSFAELLGNEDSDGDDDDGSMKGGKHDELLLMKMTDLRSLAKSRGVKGFSKMKKTELVDLLADT